MNEYVGLGISALLMLGLIINLLRVSYLGNKNSEKPNYGIFYMYTNNPKNKKILKCNVDDSLIKELSSTDIAHKSDEKYKLIYYKRYNEDSMYFYYTLEGTFILPDRINEKIKTILN